MSFIALQDGAGMLYPAQMWGPDYDARYRNRACDNCAGRCCGERRLLNTLLLAEDGLVFADLLFTVADPTWFTSFVLRLNRLREDEATMITRVDIEPVAGVGQALDEALNAVDDEDEEDQYDD